MNLTSDLDFSLTKKRLNMMSKRSSAFMKRTRASLLLILTFSIGLMFCTNSMDGFHPIEEIMMNGVVYKSEPVLYVHSDTKWGETKNGSKYRTYENRRIYSVDKNAFTGERAFYNERTGNVAWIDTFERGLNTKTVFVDETLITNNGAFELHHIYKNDEQIEMVAYNKDKAVVYKWETSDSMTRHYGPNEQLTLDSHSEIIDGKRVHSLREWHPNGQLKFEMTSDSLGYQGFMTLYDEQGDVLQQERYKDGELIEKIK